MKNIDLVYRGGNVGLMGLISQTLFDGGRHVLGYTLVIPKRQFIMFLQITSVTIGEVKPIKNIHQRKAKMSLYFFHFNVNYYAGGYDSLEELFEVITWAQLGIHSKPLGLLNIDGYYNSLLFFIDQAEEEDFIKQSAYYIIVFASNAKELIEKLKVMFTIF
ncbi:LOG family protein [Dioscorea alata]|uniref:LOG family protein n=1 Tax=Dioscorea alata TaxID=55571 RepID=A0ACB7TY71_DIOAL|nr:LOG family protein [Dioscorea alata]